MKISNYLKSMKLQHALPILFTLLLAACGTVRGTDSKSGVGMSGVNYSDQAIFYALSDPNNPSSVGGEPVDPFGAGGLVCCFSLPEKWQPGIKVRVQFFDTHRKDIKDEIVDLPPYVDGEPGQLWAVYYQDGSSEVFSSKYGPPSVKWPAKVKGWPVATVEYRRKLWEQDLEQKRIDVRAAKQLLKDLKDAPEKELKDSWKHDQRYRENEITYFSGPEDPAYKEYLLKRYENYLERSQQAVDDWMMRKP